MTRLTFPALLAASAMLASTMLTSCAARPYPAYAIENDAEQVSNVVVSDASLQDVVRVGTALVEQGRNGFRVIVPVRNIDSEQIQVLAQVTFLDADRRPVGDSSNQQVQIIGPGHTVDLEWTSLSSRAADYTLRLAWNK
ncbi:MAG: hypothetical protein NXI31_14160 [bacterium]|nr:hypothetical protein [bacterium]